jgi:hypothetical protein
MANNYMKKSSKSLATREMQIKTVKVQLTSVRVAIIKKTNTSKFWRGCVVGVKVAGERKGERRKETLYTIDGNIN